MSKRRPGKIERLQDLLLATAKEAAEVAEDYNIRMLQIQREIECLENGGSESSPVKIEPGGRHDALDRLPESKLGVVYGSLDMQGSEAMGLVEFEAESPEVNWKARCGKVLSFAVCMLSDIASPQEKRPKLKAMVGLFALGVPALPSKRSVAESQGVSPEWVSKETEILIERFKLPINDYNKPPEAVVKYKEIAAWRAKPA